MLVQKQEGGEKQTSELMMKVNLMFAQWAFMLLMAGLLVNYIAVVFIINNIISVISVLLILTGTFFLSVALFLIYSNFGRR